MHLFLFSKFEAIPDNMTPEEILAAAREAAKDAADELTMRKPKSKVRKWFMGILKLSNKTGILEHICNM